MVRSRNRLIVAYTGTSLQLYVLRINVRCLVTDQTGRAKRRRECSCHADNPPTRVTHRPNALITCTSGTWCACLFLVRKASMHIKHNFTNVWRLTSAVIAVKTKTVKNRYKKHVFLIFVFLFCRQILWIFYEFEPLIIVPLSTLLAPVSDRLC